MAATESMTSEEKEKVQRQQDAVDAQQTEKKKEKVIGPREWGNVKLNEDEMDPETQDAILENFQEQHDRDRVPKKEKSKKNVPKNKSDNESDVNKKNQTPEMIGLKKVASAGHAQPVRRAGSMPASQIAPTSSVGRALEKIADKVEEKLTKGRIKTIQEGT
jgi:hypothetical protein